MCPTAAVKRIVLIRLLQTGRTDSSLLLEAGGSRMQACVRQQPDSRDISTGIAGALPRLELGMHLPRKAYRSVRYVEK